MNIRKFNFAMVHISSSVYYIKSLLVYTPYLRRKLLVETNWKYPNTLKPVMVFQYIYIYIYIDGTWKVTHREFKFSYIHKAGNLGTTCLVPKFFTAVEKSFTGFWINIIQVFAQSITASALIYILEVFETVSKNCYYVWNYEYLCNTFIVLSPV